MTRALASMVVVLLLGSAPALAQDGAAAPTREESEGASAHEGESEDATLPLAPSREREGQSAHGGESEDATLPPAPSREREGQSAHGGESASEAEGEPAPAREESAPAPAPGRLADGSLDPCATDLRSRPVGPLSVGPHDGQLGVPYRACPRNEVAIGGDALLVADTADFYGNIHASGRLRLSMLLDPNVEGFVSWEALRYQTAISSVAAAYLGLGYLSYGATARVLSGEGRVLAITGRLVLPTTSGLDQSSQPLALDLGLTGAWQADPNFRFHMWLVLLGSLGIGAGPAEPRGGLSLGGGVDWRPWEWISFVLEVNAGFGYRDALDQLAAQAGVRLALGTEVGLELAASMPLLGARAFDSGALPLAATLMLSWHLR